MYACKGEHAAGELQTFYLKEFYPDDTVRSVVIAKDPGAAGSESWFWGPCLDSMNDTITEEMANGQLVDQTFHEELYRGSTDYFFRYKILASEDQRGCDILSDSSYLHTNRPDRLISIGIDPNSYYIETIDAVAIPLDANVTSIYDYQPYRHIEMGGWDVFYYDISDIQGHVSIHIIYGPGTETPEPLDWTEVEAAR